MDIDAGVLFSWGMSLLPFAAFFFAVHKSQNPDGRGVPFILARIFVVILCIHVNGILAYLFSAAAIDVFGISTAGFLNLNELALLAVCWMLAVLLVMAGAWVFRKRIAPYEKTVQRSQAVFLFLPLLLLMIFLALAA